MEEKRIISHCLSNDIEGDLSFHGFPENELLRLKWCSNLGLTNELDNSARVCSKHFSKDDFETDLKSGVLNRPRKWRLKSNAEPHFYLYHIKQEPEEVISVDPPQTLPAFIPQVSNIRSLGDSVFQSSLEQSAGTPVIQDAVVTSIHSAPANVYAQSALPARNEWKGEFDFKVFFGQQEKNIKAVSWTYSQGLNKLYVVKDIRCPINFAINAPAHNMSLRSMALYSSPEHTSDAVYQCEYHSSEEIKKDVPEARHFIRCDSNLASYEQDQITKRHSVVIPFENPPVGQDFSTYIFQFACYSSCVGGPSRRQLTIVFTLEKEGQVVGRQKFDIKVCACPGRDRNTEENQINGTIKKPSSVKRKNVEMVSLAETLEFTKAVTFPESKKIKKEKNEDDNGPYFITVYDSESYKFLKQMKKFYEICKTMANMPPDIKKDLFLQNRKTNL